MSSVAAITFERCTAVTSSDTTDDPNGPFGGFYVGASGAIHIITLAGDSVILPAVNTGVIYPIAIRRVGTSATGTTATGIYGVGSYPFAGKAGA